MNQEHLNLLQSKNESWKIYQTFGNREFMSQKCFNLECVSIRHCLDTTLEVLLKIGFSLTTGSAGEGTDFKSEDYGSYLHSTTPSYISDLDTMEVMCGVRVIDEGDTFPQRFDNYIYCQAERGEHTTAGFRKLRIVHRPEYYSPRKQHCANIINKSVEYGYISSSTFVAAATAKTLYTPLEDWLINSGNHTNGPSQVLERDNYTMDLVSCFYVKTWPKEAESWFTRQMNWPDRKLKSRIRKIGYLLVPTGNSNSQESDLEWRCSFSIAEKILFQSMTKFQRCTFVMLKALLKVYLPSDINTNGEKKVLSTYHMKTLFLWSLEDSNIEWKPENMLDIIGHLLDELSEWIKHEYFPNYFIPSVNILDSRRLHGREQFFICCISAIRNDLSNKIKQSQFYKSQKSNQLLASSFLPAGMDRWLAFKHIHQNVMQYITGAVQIDMHMEVFINMHTLRKLNISHSVLIEGLISIQHDIDPQGQHLYSTMYSYPIHDKLLTKVVPGLIDQYRGSIHLAKYCMAARDGRVLPDVLHTAESLLTDTLHLDPCSGYIKLACLYIVTEDFVKAMGTLHIAENKFLFIHKDMVSSALINVQLNGIEADGLSIELTVIIHELFQKWADGQLISNIYVTWLEYITAPDLVQYEMIHESTQHVIHVLHEITHHESTRKVIDVPDQSKDELGKMVGFDCHLQWPPLSMIKLLKFVCAFNSSQPSTSLMEKLVTDVIASSLSIAVLPQYNDRYIVFNMAAWCYVKIKKYKEAAHMMTVAIWSSSQTEVMKRCAFSHQFMSYILAQCLL